MDRVIIKKLKNFCENKKKASIEKRIKIIDVQFSYISRFENNEKLEKEYVNKIIKNIKELEMYKEFNISKKEFEKILKEKNVEENFYILFLKEIEELQKEINKIKEILEAQKENGSSEDLLAKEEEEYVKLENLFKKLNYSESAIGKYFENMQLLRYDKRYIRGGQIVAKVINKTLFRVDVEGIENIPKRGACILAPHHHHASLDSLILISIINRKLFFLTCVKAFLNMPSLGNLIYAIGCLPIKRNDRFYGERRKDIISEEREKMYPSSNKTTLLYMVNLLKYGEAVVVFPEGDAKVGSGVTYIRLDNREFVAPHKGFVRLAFLAKRKHNIDVPIIPIGFNYEMGVRKIKVKIGKPIYLDPKLQEMDEAVVNYRIEYYTNHIFDMIKQLCK